MSFKGPAQKTTNSKHDKVLTLPGEIESLALDEGFYARKTKTVAREILGKVLLKKAPEGWTGGIIVEAEAYLGSNDPACHAARGMTPRNRPMFGPPGRAYVYFIYGMYHCFNCVAFDQESEKAGAVLIRALQPVAGIDLMRQRRGRSKTVELASGPGKLCGALGINREDNSKPLFTGDLLVCDLIQDQKITVIRDKRIGINTGCGLKLRYYAEGNPNVSRTRPGKAR